MGAERQDRDAGAPSSRKSGTEPGLGGVPPAAVGRAPVAASAGAEDDGPEAVDFDALHAALGDPLEFEELPPAAMEVQPRVGESSGRTNAAYASARPHTIPPSHSPTVDLDAPPVIVASEDTVPSAPPQMTMPVGHARGPIGATPQSGVPFLVGPQPGGSPPPSNPALTNGQPPSGPQHLGHPGSGPHASAPPGAHTPQAFPVQRGAPQLTVRMPDRPINKRRGNAQTLIMRPRGPSAKQKLFAFMAMLLLVTVGGIAMVVLRKSWLGLDPSAPAVATSVGPASSLPAPEVTAPAPGPVVASAQAMASAAGIAPPTASVRIIRPRAATAAPPPSAGPSR